MPKIGIYTIKNKINGKIYIGQSTNINNRFDNHKSLLNLNKHQNSDLQKDWILYGKENFVFQIYLVCKKEELTLNERKTIEMFDFIPNSVYNKTIPINTNNFGMTKKHHSELSKQKIRIKNREKKRNKMKPIERINIITGEIKEYECINDAERDGFNRSRISQCCNLKIKQHAGFYWCFKFQKLFI